MLRARSAVLRLGASSQAIRNSLRTNVTYVPRPPLRHEAPPPVVDEDILQNKPNKGKALFLVAVAGAVLGVGGLWTADLLFERATKSRRMKQDYINYLIWKEEADAAVRIDDRSVMIKFAPNERFSDATLNDAPRKPAAPDQVRAEAEARENALHGIAAAEKH